MGDREAHGHALDNAIDNDVVVLLQMDPSVTDLRRQCFNERMEFRVSDDGVERTLDFRDE